MASKTLTRSEGYALQAACTAVGLSATVLQTRTACYQWNADADCWERTHAQQRVVHCRGDNRRGWRWDRQLKQFLPCTCPTCERG